MIKLFDFVLSRSLTFENKELKKNENYIFDKCRPRGVFVCVCVCGGGGGGGMVGT